MNNEHALNGSHISLYVISIEHILWSVGFLMIIFYFISFQNRSQLCINTAIVYMHRFYAFHSFTHFHRNSIAAAALFLAGKVNIRKENISINGDIHKVYLPNIRLGWRTAKKARTCNKSS